MLCSSPSCTKPPSNQIPITMQSLYVCSWDTCCAMATSSSSCVDDIRRPPIETKPTARAQDSDSDELLEPLGVVTLEDVVTPR